MFQNLSSLTWAWSCNRILFFRLDQTVFKKYVAQLAEQSLQTPFQVPNLIDFIYSTSRPVFHIVLY